MNLTDLEKRNIVGNRITLTLRLLEDVSTYRSLQENRPNALNTAIQIQESLANSLEALQDMKNDIDEKVHILSVVEGAEDEAPVMDEPTIEEPTSSIDDLKLDDEPELSIGEGDSFGSDGESTTTDSTKWETVY